MTTQSTDPGQSRTMKASEFKAKCLGLMDEMAENGKPVAKLTAYHERPNSLFGIDKGRLKIKGDIISPSTLIGKPSPTLTGCSTRDTAGHPRRPLVEGWRRQAGSGGSRRDQAGLASRGRRDVGGIYGLERGVDPRHQDSQSFSPRRPTATVVAAFAARSAHFR